MMQDKRFLPGKGDKLYRDENYIAAVFGGKRKLLCAFGMDSPRMGEDAVLMDHIIFAIKERI